MDKKLIATILIAGVLGLTLATYFKMRMGQTTIGSGEYQLSSQEAQQKAMVQKKAAIQDARRADYWNLSPQERHKAGTEVKTRNLTYLNDEGAGTTETERKTTFQQEKVEQLATKSTSKASTGPIQTRSRSRRV